MFSVGGASSAPALPVYLGLTPELRARQTERMANSGSVKAEIEYFRNNVGKVKTPDEFFKNFRLLKFALKAYGLEDQMQYPARIQQVMKGDPSDPSSLVRRMTSLGYRDINAAFRFYDSGVNQLNNPDFINTVVERFKRATYEESLGQTSADIPDALYFERRIAAVRNGYEIIGDPVLFRVVKTALNFKYAANANVEKLKATIESRIDMSRLGDQKYVKNIVQRFLALSDMEQRQTRGGGLIDIFA